MMRKYKSLQDENPMLASEWNYDKNGELKPTDVSLMSSKKVWWICNKGHEWEMLVSVRSGQKQNCPFCANKRACKDNCLATQYPEISKEWDFIKNEGLTPLNVLPHSHKKVWWICNNGHNWLAWVSDRTNGVSHCTQCEGYVIRNRKEINTRQGFRICKFCKKELSLDNFRLKLDKRENKKRIDNICKQCSFKGVDEYRKTDIGIAAEIVRRTKYISKKNGLAFDLDKEWVFNRLNEINWKCELTGLPMMKSKKVSYTKNIEYRLNSLSIDKINPNKGYIKSNVRFILNQINTFKQDGDDKQMYMLAEALIRNKK